MRLMALVLTTALLAGTSLAHAETAPAQKKVPHHPQTERLVRRQGKASYYNDSFQGKKTATGEKCSQEKMTAASKDLPLGSQVTVTNKKNGKSVESVPEAVRGDPAAEAEAARGTRARTVGNIVYIGGLGGALAAEITGFALSGTRKGPPPAAVATFIAGGAVWLVTSIIGMGYLAKASNH